MIESFKLWPSGISSFAHLAGQSLQSNDFPESLAAILPRSGGLPMTDAVSSHAARLNLIFCLMVCSIALLLPCSANAQLLTFSKQDLIDYTAENPFDRFPDGRPKVPDDLIERARDVSSEEVWAVLQAKGFNNQYADGFIVLHPGMTMVGRVFTVQFMPIREDVAQVAEKKAKERGIPRLTNQTAIDMLQPGDVLVVDMFGKKVNGTIVGDNLFFYINQATHGGGLVVDGSIRDLDGLSEIDMPGYFMSVDPTPIGNVMLTGINVPVRIHGVTVMPGDLAVGDREGVYFIPPQFVKEVLDRADEIHIHDEWTKKKFAEGKYKSSDIYGSPHDPQLIKEYQDYLKKRLDEIHKQRSTEHQP
jgi:4-hydroxy-4-methyl-2-oxoglutarate aldolase